MRISVVPPLCMTEQHFPKYSLDPQGLFTSEGEGSREPVSSCPPHTSSVRALRGLGLCMGKQVPLLKGIKNTGLGQQSGSSVASTSDSPDPPLACLPWLPVSSRPWLQTAASDSQDRLSGAASSPPSSTVSLRVNVGSPLRTCACWGCPCCAWFMCYFEKAISKQS